jgi:hypothetical protein
VLAVLAAYAAVAACSSFAADSGPVAGTGTGDLDAASADESVDSQATDAAATDGGWVACGARKPAPAYCADFDEPDHGPYDLGTRVSLPVVGPNARVMFGMPAVSAPFAMAIATRTDRYKLESYGTSTIYTVHASFDVRFVALNTGRRFAIAVVGARNTAFDHCYLSLELGGDRMYLQEHCGKVDGGTDVQSSPTVLAAIPALDQWLHFDLLLDLSAETITFGLDDRTAAVFPLGVAPSAGDLHLGGTSYVAFGIIDPVGADTGEVTISFDNILAETK